MKKSISGMVIVFAAIYANTLYAAVPCESLMGFAMKNVTITIAQAVGAGEFTPPPAARGAARRPLLQLRLRLAAVHLLFPIGTSLRSAASR